MKSTLKLIYFMCICYFNILDMRVLIFMIASILVFVQNKKIVILFIFSSSLNYENKNKIVKQ